MVWECSCVVVTAERIVVYSQRCVAFEGVLGEIASLCVIISQMTAYI